MSVQKETKAAVTVAEMARMCGLSRSRFYQLIGTAFPRPERQPQTGRPIYTEELQQVCLEVRRRNWGIDGKAVLFYARRSFRTGQAEGTEAEVGAEGQGRVGAGGRPERPRPDHGDGGAGSAGHRGVVSARHGGHRPGGGLAGGVPAPEGPELGGQGAAVGVLVSPDGPKEEMYQ